jgi:hypothetical protein
MTKLLLSSQQQAKLAEALELAKLAEEKGLEMSELATKIANNYQQRLFESAQSASKPAN